jgi:5,10-methylenetetrahydromethanopterin reductase
MDIACAFPPMAATPSHIALAERLGYTRAWVFDTPALQLDPWITLALAAERTSVIGLGPGVLIPSLRHPMVTASAIAHLCLLAPGRVEVGVGAGFTGRNAMGKGGLPWAYVTRYVQTVQTLLAGERAEWDGALLAMLHWPGQAPDRPLRVPWRVAIAGPRGVAAARELGAGIFSSRMTNQVHFGGLPAVTQMLSGTVVDDGEDLLSDRVVAAVAPGVAILYHRAAERGDHAALRALPGGERWLAALADIAPGERHLAIHHGHLSQVNALDRHVISEEMLRLSALLHPAAEVPALLQNYADQGATEVAFEPMGDIPAELERFAGAAGLAPR